jgi:formylglycine-generating enzyme required for sulfatase activity
MFFAWSWSEVSDVLCTDSTEFIALKRGFVTCWLLLTLVFGVRQSEQCCAQSPKEITNRIGLKLVMISKGTFKMGSPSGEKGVGHDERQPRFARVHRWDEFVSRVFCAE